MRKWKVLYYLGITVAVLAIIGIIVYEAVACHQKEELSDLREEAIEAAPTVETVPYAEGVVETAVVNPDTGLSETVQVDSGLICPVDFFTLWDACTDIYAWLRIPGTTIDYPVLHRTDSIENQDYYLRKDLEGNYSTAGNLYTQYFYNWNLDEDPITVIYGHHMRDESMFGPLDDYSDEEFIESHKYFYFYTSYHSYRYRVIGVVTHSNENIFLEYSNYEEGDFDRFVDDFNTGVFGTGWIEDGFSLNSSDRVFILSTCNSMRTERFLVVGVLEEVL